MATVALVAGIDPTLPDVTLAIGGKVRQLAYDMGAIVTAEKLTGLNLLKAARTTALSFSETRGLLFAALLKDEPTLTLDEMNAWPIMYNLLTIQAAISEAWFGSVTAPKDDATGEGEARTETSRKKASPSKSGACGRKRGSASGSRRRNSTR